MLAAERQARILDIIRKQGSVQVDELARSLSVSSMTIRRDLVKLQESDLLERCHGGAVAKQEVAYADKSISHREEKLRIASACYSLVSEGDNVFFDAGTTTYEIAKLVKDIPKVITFTNDIEIACLLKDSPADVVICGGWIQKSTGSVLGYYATQILNDFRFDVGFFGAASINDEMEVSTPTVDKAFLKRTAQKRCRRSYLVVDSSKFGKQAMNRVSQLSEYTAVITDKEFTKKEQEIIKKTGVRILKV